MKLIILENHFSIVKLEPGFIPLINTIENSALFSITYTPEECSIVCPSDHTFENHSLIAREDGWRSLKIDGILDFSLTGILAELSSLLAEHEISIFALSTFNTDYILLKEKNLDKSKDILKKAGYEVQS